MLQIHVNLAECRGHGQCAIAAPSVFEIGDDDVAHVLGPVDDGKRQLVQLAVDRCPEHAIRLGT